ncbi:MAG: hypothetical protein NUW01_12955 [Gemmatimonadaceae bacterium]|nr:hypothetical protein [Gemmatimonadaceae bacterium]
MGRPRKTQTPDSEAAGGAIASAFDGGAAGDNTAEALADRIQGDDATALGPTETTINPGGPDAYEQGWRAGYDAGYAAACAGAKLPLFETCKQAVTANYDVPPETVHEIIDSVEADYGDTLSRADRNLIVAHARRLRQAARARAAGERPKTEVPPVQRRRQVSAPTVTEYEVIT